MKRKIAVVGLGYVGLPLAVAFSSKHDVVGFDINGAKIDAYRKGEDPTNELGPGAVRACAVDFTTDAAKIMGAEVVIVATPTPVDAYNNPDLTLLAAASRTVGRNLERGAVVVYESTVYPGVTEEYCAPILEKESGLRCGVDFKIGYSPERINPGDKEHRLENILKIVSACDEDALELIAETYASVIKAGVYKASSIKVAEAAKVIENAQRDINIAFVNELSIIFDRMGIDTREVLTAAGTKWNFLEFYPGLVGGHCISVDPYYLAYKANALGYNPEVILSGRRINDRMGEYVAGKAIKLMANGNVHINGADVLILGVTFKEDVPDVRNSRVFDIADGLREYGVNVSLADPHGDSCEIEREYGYQLSQSPPKADALVLAVDHREYRDLTPDQIRDFLKPGAKIVIDVKGTLNEENMRRDFTYWRL